MEGSLSLSAAWFVRARRLAVMGRAWASSSGHAELAERFHVLMSVVDRVEKKRNRIALAGAFSAGKTTVLNGFIGEEGEFRLPTGVGETTAIPTVVRPADKSRLLLWQDGRLVEAPEAIRTEFLQLTKDSIGPILRMYLQTQSELIFETPMDEALLDIEFLDLPGLLGSDSRLDRVAALGVRGSDAVIFVVNAQQGLTRTDIEFLEKEIYRDKPIMILVTHLDLKPPSQRKAIVEAIRSRSKALGANIVGIAETSDSRGALTTSGYRILFEKFMARLDASATLKGMMRDTLNDFSNLIRDPDGSRYHEDPFAFQILDEGRQISNKPNIKFPGFDSSPSTRSEDKEETRLVLYKEKPMLSNSPCGRLRKTHRESQWYVCYENVYERVCIAMQRYGDIGEPERSSQGKKTKNRRKIGLFTKKRLRSSQGKKTKNRRKIGLFTKKRLSRTYIVSTERKRYGGPYLDAHGVIVSVDGNRWAAAVKENEGWKIVTGFLDKPLASGNDSHLRTSKVFDLVSNPWFLADGRILFAGARNGKVTFETM